MVITNPITHNFVDALITEFTWENAPTHLPNLVDYCLNQEKPSQVESNISITSKHNLWESAFNFLEGTNNSLSALKIWITQTCQDYINSLNRSNYRFVITESWAHVTRENGYHLPHYHPGSAWSGIFYIQCSPGLLGKNFWLAPYNLERKPGLEFINDNISVTPTPGRLILFPSMISHYAEPYIGKDPRIVVAFNSICVK